MANAIKRAFAGAVAEYERKHGKMYFAFDDVHLPVQYHGLTDVLTAKVAEQSVSVVVDYNLDLEDNLQRLLDVLLEKYPSLTE